MKKTESVKKKSEHPPMAGIKMDKGLFRKAKGRAKERHQTLSEYVRQLIVCDLRAKA